MLEAIIKEAGSLELRHFSGKIVAMEGLRLEAVGPKPALVPGAIVRIGNAEHGPRAELVGFTGNHAILLACDNLDDVFPGMMVHFCPKEGVVRPCSRWLGRILGAFGEPRDGKEALPQGGLAMPLSPPAPEATKRERVRTGMVTGIAVLDTFVPCAAGQRLGLFSGSGIGKSTLLSMLARNCVADVVVIGMIGERGREVREFVEDAIGEANMSRTVVVASTSDESAPRRRRAARLTLTIAEYFRDQGLQVLCLLDSVTRFAHAQREIGLSAGEPITTRGFTPSVFAELPRLLERAGPGIIDNRTSRAGSITGFFTVLVEGDDHDEPIADAVRGILDGHVVMSRRIAERGRHPAIDPLRSLSRLEALLHDDNTAQLVAQARRLLSLYADMEELVRIGAYNRGEDAELDRAVSIVPELEQFMSQAHDEQVDPIEAKQQLSAILTGSGTVPTIA